MLVQLPRIIEDVMEMDQAVVQTPINKAQEHGTHLKTM